jgi:hypothetical protein
LGSACASDESSAGAAASPSVTSKSLSSPTPSLAAGLACEIPFVASDKRLYSTSDGTAGFLKVPEGTFRTDPSGAITQSVSGQYSIGAAPVLPGQFFNGYRWWDGEAKRWLPVPSQQIAPDGTRYVYQVGPDIHLVTVATGADTVIYHQPSGMPSINVVGQHLFAYRGGAVYLSVNDSYKTGGGGFKSVPADEAGVWRLDIGGSPPRRLISHGLSGMTDDGGVVWAVELDNQSPPTGTLVRYDLTTARKESWYVDPGHGMDILGTDRDGKPIVWTYDYQGHVKILRISGSDVADAIYTETYSGYISIYGGNGFEFGSLITDSYGSWFGSVNGLFLYDSTGFHKVADTPGIPVGRCS